MGIGVAGGFVTGAMGGMDILVIEHPPYNAFSSRKIHGHVISAPYAIALQDVAANGWENRRK